MLTDYQLMLNSLEALADKGIEIEPMVGQAYLNLQDIDHQVYEDGNALQLEYMVTKVAEMMLFFAEGNPRTEELGYYDVPFHDDLGVTGPMYEAYMQVFIQVFAEQLGDAWDAATADAWQRQSDAMLKVIKQHSEVA